MRFRVVILPQARIRIREATRFYRVRSGSDEIANRWLDGLLNDLKRLSDRPERFPIANESDQFDFVLRETHYGSGRSKTHRVLFRIVGEMVEILTVRHASQQDVTPDTL